MCASMGRAEFKSLPERAFLHQHPRARASHRRALCNPWQTLLGVSDQACLGHWEQHRLSSSCTQTQSPASYPWYRLGLLGLLPSFLDLAAASPLPARHAADSSRRDAGDSESNPHRAHVWELMCESIFLHAADRKTKTQPTDADINKSALPQEQSATVVYVSYFRDNNVRMLIAVKSTLNKT